MKALTTKTVLFLIVFTLGSMCFAQPKGVQVNSDLTPVENRYAFVIGIDHYEDPSISSLASCRLDAVRFSAFLKSNAGWRLPKNRLSIVLDAGKKEIMSAMTRLLNTIENPEMSTLYFYFSGHGVKGSLVPSDYIKDQPETLLSYSWIKEELKKRNIKAQVFVIDACYSGSIIRTKSASGFDENYMEAITEGQEGSNMVVFTATNSYRVTAAGKHESVYSKFFLDAIENKRADRNRDNILSSGELFAEIQEKMGSLNTPQFAGTTDFPMANFVQRTLSSNTVGGGRAASYAQANSRAMVEDEAVTHSGAASLLRWRREVETKPINREAAMVIIEGLETTNTPECRAKIGFMYREGIGVEKDINKALSYFIPSAADGCAFAEYNLGYLYRNGLGLKEDRKKAKEFYTKAAEKGDPFAQNNFGIEYAKKKGGLFGHDFDKAVYWFEKAAAQGNTGSQLALAILYKNRSQWTLDKVKKADFLEKAFHWFTEASNSENARAQFELAKCFELGLGTDPDPSMAKYWYKRACENGQLQSCRKVLTMTSERSITKI